MLRLTSALLLALSLSAVACGGGTNYGQPVHNAERATKPSTEVSEEAFAGAVRDLLSSEPNSKEREVRLRGVVGRQMTRVAERFQARDRERALSSFAGAMYLVHAGELTNDALGGRGADALRGVSDEFAKKGDEGRARASYELLARVATPAEKTEIKGHLDAIAAWTRDTAGNGPMQTAGALESAAVTRHLLEPSKEARDEAVAKTVDFIEKALAVKNARRNRSAQISREEGLEAVRAIETGTSVLIAIYLRNTDAQGALKAVNEANVREITRSPATGDLVKALEAVNEKPDADRWLDLARMLRPGQRRGEEEELGKDGEMLRVAAFHAACEAYRLDSTSPEAAAFVASMLVDLGMGDAAPAILADAVKAQKDPRIIGIGIALTMQAMGRSLEAEEPDNARRTFRAAQPLLAAVDAAKSKTQPGTAKVYGLMGDIEIREGRLDDAKKLLTASNEREKSGSVLLSLARLDWHDKQAKPALDKLKEALGTDEAQKDPGLKGEILIAESDVLRESGDMQGARAPLTEALRDLAKARGAAEAEDRARIEVMIARALDRFGASASALKALERALEAAPRDKRQTAVTVGQLVGRAFVKNDLNGARDGLLRGLSAELGREDIVYYAMWVHYLERQQKARTDGTADRVLGLYADDPRWIGKVASFGLGKLKSDQLDGAAQTPSQKTEALFYNALEKRASGDQKGAEELLKQVVSSQGLDLMEANLARDILAGPKAQIGGPVPEVGLP